MRRVNADASELPLALTSNFLIGCGPNSSSSSVSMVTACAARSTSSCACAIFFFSMYFWFSITKHKLCSIFTHQQNWLAIVYSCHFTHLALLFKIWRLMVCHRMRVRALSWVGRATVFVIRSSSAAHIGWCYKCPKYQCAVCRWRFHSCTAVSHIQFFDMFKWISVTTKFHSFAIFFLSNFA